MENATVASATPAITAESIIESIISEDDPSHLREHLRCLMDAYFLLPNDLDRLYPKEKVYASFVTLDNALKMIEAFDKTL